MPDLQKVTIRLNSGDRDRLHQYYPRLGYNAAIRKLVSAHLRKCDEKFSRTPQSVVEDMSDMQPERS